MTAPSEDAIRDVLIECRGDLVISAERIGCRPSTLVDWVRAVPKLTVVYNEIEKVKADADFDRATQAHFEDEIRRRTAAFKLDGLNVIHELAVSDHGESAAMADVRLKAAIQLRDAGGDSIQRGSNVLVELNELYRISAPRIKSMRAIQIEFESPDESDAK
jgi:hypothetical protein